MSKFTDFMDKIRGFAEKTEAKKPHDPLSAFFYYLDKQTFDDIRKWSDDATPLNRNRSYIPSFELVKPSLEAKQPWPNTVEYYRRHFDVARQIAIGKPEHNIDYEAATKAIAGTYWRSDGNTYYGAVSPFKLYDEAGQPLPRGRAFTMQYAYYGGFLGKSEELLECAKLFAAGKVDEADELYWQAVKLPQYLDQLKNGLRMHIIGDLDVQE